MTAEELIDYIEKECKPLSIGIIDRLCKRAMRIMNSNLGFIIGDDYPKTFTFFDFLACEIQSKTYDEIFFPGRLLEDYIEETLDNEYEKLPYIEKLVLSYSDFTLELGYDDYEPCNPRPLIYSRFHSKLNNHWATSKKILKYLRTIRW